MDVVIHSSAARAAAFAADRVAAEAARRPASVIGLATGATMEPLYAALVRTAAARPGLLARCRFFGLDEYAGLAPDDPAGFRRYYDAHLFGPLAIPLEHVDLLAGGAPDLDREAARYEAAIAAAGGIDLQILGLGQNGHIGFNEPLSGFRTRTRPVALSEATVTKNAHYFGGLAAAPRKAISMGIGTILDARRIVLLATGAAKQVPARDMIEGPLRALCPASALQLHAEITVVLDAAAAAGLDPAGPYWRL